MRFASAVAGGAIAGGYGLLERVLAGIERHESAPTVEKWGMAVDLKACARREGCRECIDACHRIHNVPDFGNGKDEIKWIWTAPRKRIFSGEEHGYSDDGFTDVSVIVLCNHCENPPCVKVCPVKATWKRRDGIVMIDYHRCIGCRYCMAACPYGARSFNWRDPRPHIRKVEGTFPTRTRGVVEKCNFCEERLVKGLLPACVEACPEKGLTFGDLNRKDSAVRRAVGARLTMRRKPQLGTEPKVYYVW